MKGHYGWQVRLGWKGNGGVDAVAFTTVTQVAQTIYPRLKAEGSEVVYRSASRAVVPVLPNFAAAEDVAGRYEEKALRSANVSYAGRSAKSRFAYPVKGNKPGSVVFSVERRRTCIQRDGGRPLQRPRAVAGGMRLPPRHQHRRRQDLEADGQGRSAEGQ